MKRLGSTSDFAQEREMELYNIFLELLRTAKSAALSEMFGLAARQPATRFWVSTERATKVVTDMLKGQKAEDLEKMFPLKRRMYDEIYRRVCLQLEEEPGRPLLHIVEEVINSPAPEHYVSGEWVRQMVYRRRRRLRALARISNLKNLKP